MPFEVAYIKYPLYFNNLLKNHFFLLRNMKDTADFFIKLSNVINDKYFFPAEIINDADHQHKIFVSAR